MTLRCRVKALAKGIKAREHQHARILSDIKKLSPRGKWRVPPGNPVHDATNARWLASLAASRARVEDDLRSARKDLAHLRYMQDLCRKGEEEVSWLDSVRYWHVLEDKEEHVGRKEARREEFRERKEEFVKRMGYGMVDGRWQRGGGSVV